VLNQGLRGWDTEMMSGEIINACEIMVGSPKSHLGSEGINGLVKYQRGIREIAVTV
jgi:hypothetical protein